MEMIPLIIDSKIEYLGQNLTKEVPNLYSEDYKAPLKETKDLTK